MADRDVDGWFHRLMGQLTRRGEEPGERLPTPSEIAEGPPPRRSGLESGVELAADIEPERWQDRILRQRQESDQGGNGSGDAERLRGRSLPDEQRDRDQGRSR